MIEAAPKNIDVIFVGGPLDGGEAVTSDEVNVFCLTETLHQPCPVILGEGTRFKFPHYALSSETTPLGERVFKWITGLTGND